ncbi:sperm-associated antigen 16 protein-like [Clavelina lepadiformis]|uniref:sperm-associated antigen 16 protein-like n=1 Tax=Clavelina lepadiformis TaxID=159417 RepID=UPI004043061C
MTSEVEDGMFYLERVSVLEDSGDEYEYEEVPVDDDISVATVDIAEDLEKAVHVIEEAKLDVRATYKVEGLVQASVVQHPEVVDDFVRNFLLKMNLQKTLECFQTEWYEMLQKGLLGEEDIGVVPDAYSRNEALNDEVKRLKNELEKYKTAASKAKETYVKLQKERDFHRIHHKRIVQEKNRLITDMKRLKKHYNSYEPTLRQLKHKYELAMKEKMLTKLERDRAMGQLTGLQATLRNIESGKDDKIPPHSGYRTERMSFGEGPTQLMLRESRNQISETRSPDLPPTSQTKTSSAKHVKYELDSEFPPDTRVNPHLGRVKGPPTHLTRTGGFRKTASIKAHDLAISNIAMHPRKQIAVTTSDDHLWRMWAIPSGEIIMTGEGHSDWVSDCDFHPGGAQMVTSGGDGRVKVWDFAKGAAVLTFSDHTHAVWGVSWHSCGDFLASCSMDNTSKIWDIHSERCRATLRGHTDSVNSIQFLHYANTILTSSADKTVSLWDARTGLCAQTFYGHMHSVNHAVFNLKGDTIGSCDSYGTVKFWDVRNGTSFTTIDVGPHPANKLAFDPSGHLVAAASNDGTVKMIEIGTSNITQLSGHDDAVQAVDFDMTGQFLLSGSSDGHLYVWT